MKPRIKAQIFNLAHRINSTSQRLSEKMKDLDVESALTESSLEDKVDFYCEVSSPKVNQNNSPRLLERTSRMNKSETLSRICEFTTPEEFHTGLMDIFQTVDCRTFPFLMPLKNKAERSKSIKKLWDQVNQERVVNLLLDNLADMKDGKEGEDLAIIDKLEKQITNFKRLL